MLWNIANFQETTENIYQFKKNFILIINNLNLIIEFNENNFNIFFINVENSSKKFKPKFKFDKCS